MNATPKIKAYMIRGAIIVLLLAAATITRPLAVMAETYQFDRSLILFDPYQGEFPEPDPQDGTRFPLIGETLTDFPQNPVRYGYVFDGWFIYGGPRNGERIHGNSLVADRDMTLRPVWVRYGEATSTPTPTPAATATPTPSPTSPTPTPSPTKGEAGRPNPTTSPLAISIMIFVAVLTLGLTTFSIIKITARHALATGKYRANSARYAREMRLAELLKDEVHKDVNAAIRKAARKRRRRSSFYRV